jgi:hypothetical protein
MKYLFQILWEESIGIWQEWNVEKKENIKIVVEMMIGRIIDFALEKRSKYIW